MLTVKFTGTFSDITYSWTLEAPILAKASPITSTMASWLPEFLFSKTTLTFHWRWVWSQSTIYITILFPTYASSKWCLRKLAKVECKGSMGDKKKKGQHWGHVALPIFYAVDTDLRDPKGNFGDVFHSPEKRLCLMGATREGLRALKDVSKLGGWEVVKLRYRLTSTYALFNFFRKIFA